MLGMVPESWSLLSHSADEVVVARNQDGRLTLWNLEDRGKGWRIYKVTFSRDNVGCNGHAERMKYYAADAPIAPCQEGRGLCWDRQLHANGQRLTDQRFHRILLDYCEGRRG